MLQNRINPYGEIVKTSKRGTWLGNRGVLHNPQQEIIRIYKLKAWITCELNFRGRHREVMQPERWTELFFLDEATASAAGHRPCFQCRFSDHQRFKEFWLKGNPEHGFNQKTPIAKIDEIIHSERISANKTKVTYEEKIGILPKGTFISHNHQPYLIKNNQLYLWSFAGYENPIPFPKKQIVTVLTPRSIVNMYTAGYIPQMAI